MIARPAEAIAVGTICGALAAVTGGLIGLAVPAGVVGAVNGVVSGWLGIYDLGRPQGWVALILDSTWGVVGIGLGLVLHGVNLFMPRSGYEPELSRRQDRHVYAGGAALKPGFALTLGNVVSNGGGRAGLRGESEAVARRRRFVIAHEGLHIWQNRWFGPSYQGIYLLWLVTGAVIGTLVWPVAKGRWWSAVETVAYYDNPFEYWAYRHDGYWPPRGIHPRLGWRKRVPRRR